MPIMARSSHALRQQAEYTTASDFDHRRDHFLADVREESIYTLLEAFVTEMKTHQIACGLVENPGWGLITHVSLPGGGRLGVYQPRHARPGGMRSGRSTKTPARRTTKKGSNASHRKASIKKARRR
jgi:hypothetical protein